MKTLAEQISMELNQRKTNVASLYAVARRMGAGLLQRPGDTIFEFNDGSRVRFQSGRVYPI